MNKKGVWWITAIVAVVLLTGFAFTNSDFICQTGEQLGIVKASSGCDYHGDATNAAVTTASQSKAFHCPEGSASDCPYSKQKAVQAQKQDCSGCPYSKSKASIAQKNVNSEEDALTSVE